MEKLDLLVEGENGQMEVNFESLEALTSEEFVQLVKRQFKNGCKLVSCQNENSFVDVKFFSPGLYIILTYSKADGYIRTSNITLWELRDLYNYSKENGVF